MGLKLTGDTVIASRYIGWAKQRLDQLKRAMTDFGVKADSRHYNLEEAVVQVSSAYGLDNIAIVGLGGVEYLYVADTWNNRVQKFTTGGGFVKTWGTYGPATGQFEYPFDVAVYQKQVYVANRNMKSIDMFTPDGAFINRVVVANSPISHIAIGEGKVAVVVPLYLGSYPTNDMVLVYNLADWTLAYTLTGITYYAISGVEIANGHLFVGVDDPATVLGRIKVFNLSTGALTYTYDAPVGSKPSFYENIKYYAGKLYATANSIGGDIQQQRVAIMDVATDGSLSPNSIWGTTGTSDGQFYGTRTGGIRGIAVGKTGVYVSEVNDGLLNNPHPDADRVQCFSNSGTFKLKIGLTGTGNGQFNSPYSLAIGDV